MIQSFSSPSKQNSAKLFSTIRISFCGNLAYQKEQSKVKVFFFLHTLSLLIVSLTKALFCTIQKMLTLVKNLRLSVYGCAVQKQVKS